MIPPAEKMQTLRGGQRNSIPTFYLPELLQVNVYQNRYRATTPGSPTHRPRTLLLLCCRLHTAATTPIISGCTNGPSVSGRHVDGNVKGYHCSVRGGTFEHVNNCTKYVEEGLPLSPPLLAPCDRGRRFRSIKRDGKGPPFKSLLDWPRP